MKGKIYPATVVVLALITLGICIGYIWSQHNKVIADVSVANFQQQVLQSPKPVFLEFYIPNCKPCSQEMTLLEKIAHDYDGKVRFVKVDALKSPQIAMAAQLRGVPTALFVRPQDDIIIKLQGFQDEASLRQFIDKALTATKQDLAPPAAPTDNQPAAPTAPSTPNAAPAAPTAPTGTPNAAPSAPVAPAAPTAAPAAPAQPSAAPAAPAQPTTPDPQKSGALGESGSLSIFRALDRMSK
ncbi:MAG TPA: thioredoxin domain-containing protein [Candidatus Obscuribacterales bacterium]